MTKTELDNEIEKWRYKKPYVVRAKTEHKVTGTILDGKCWGSYSTIDKAIARCHEFMRDNGDGKYAITHRVWVEDRSSANASVVFELERD